MLIKLLGVLWGVTVIVRDLWFGREELSRKGGEYGQRWHLLGPLWKVLSKHLGFPSIYLNHFVRADDPVPHNHPRAILSFIFSGYVETITSWRKHLSVRRSYIRKPWTWNFIPANRYHFIAPLDKRNGAWTITLVGPTWGRRWGFWWKGKHVDSKDYKREVLKCAS